MIDKLSWYEILIPLGVGVILMALLPKIIPVTIDWLEKLLF